MFVVRNLRPFARVLEAVGRSVPPRALCLGGPGSGRSNNEERQGYLPSVGCLCRSPLSEPCSLSCAISGIPDSPRVWPRQRVKGIAIIIILRMVWWKRAMPLKPHSVGGQVTCADQRWDETRRAVCFHQRRIPLSSSWKMPCSSRNTCRTKRSCGLWHKVYDPNVDILLQASSCGSIRLMTFIAGKIACRSHS